MVLATSAENATVLNDGKRICSSSLRGLIGIDSLWKMHTQSRPATARSFVDHGNVNDSAQRKSPDEPGFS